MFETPSIQPRPVRHLPRTLAVLVLLATAAASFSYLGAFAFTGLLVSADLLDRWPPNADPRPRWMTIAFAAMIGVFLLVGLCCKWTSWRQARELRTIEAEEPAAPIQSQG